MASPGHGVEIATSPADAEGRPALDAGVEVAEAGPIAAVVSGRVIDFFARPVANVVVRIGEVTTLTDATGAFSIPDVNSPYDVALLINGTHYENPVRYGYRYDGLTRRDPTLQVYAALPERDATLTIRLDNTNFTATNRSVLFAFSSPDARFASTLDNAATEMGTGWTGPVTTSGTAHALTVLNSDDGAGEVPTAYEAYQSAPLAASDGAAATVLFDLSTTSSLAVGTLGGSAGGGVLGDRQNFVSLRFVDGTALTVVDDAGASEAFSYLVPTLPGASLILAAADGFGFPDPYGVVHRENLAPGQTNVALTVPNPVRLVNPPAGGEAGGGDRFEWSSLGQTARTFVWHLQLVDTHDEFFVVTANTSIDLPGFADGSSWAPGTPAGWSVQTHGDAADVDALTGPSGFMDAFSYSFSSSEGAPVGPNRSDGYFTESQQQAVTLR